MIRKNVYQRVFVIKKNTSTTKYNQGVDIGHNEQDTMNRLNQF